MFINKHSVTDICHKNDFFKLVIKNTSAAKLKKTPETVWEEFCRVSHIDENWKYILCVFYLLYGW